MFLLLPSTLMADRIMSSRADMLGLESHSWDSIKHISDLPAMIFGMRNVLHLAASFSPLIVLVPKKFTQDTIRRDHLLAVRLISLIPVHWLMSASARHFLWKSEAKSSAEPRKSTVANGT
jgi:hypothetical protein